VMRRVMRWVMSGAMRWVTCEAMCWSMGRSVRRWMSFVSDFLMSFSRYLPDLRYAYFTNLGFSHTGLNLWLS
jgi:hypothetical protein